MDCSDPVSYPDSFLHQEGASKSGRKPENALQWNQTAASTQHTAQTASVPASGVVDYRAGASLQGPVTHQQLQSAHGASDPPLLERLGIRQLQQLLGMNIPSRDVNCPGKHQLLDGQWDAVPPAGNVPRTLLPQKRQHATSPSQLLPSSINGVSATDFTGNTTLTGSRQPAARHSFCDSQSSPWPQARTVDDFNSLQASVAGVRAHAVSACGQQQFGREPLLRHQATFQQPIQAALQAVRNPAVIWPSGQTLRDTLHGGKQSLHKPPLECPTSFALPFRPVSQSSSLASTEAVDSSFKLCGPTPSKAMLLAPCPSQAVLPLSNQTSPHRPTLLASSNEQLSQGSNNASMGDPLRPNPWLNLPTRALAPPLSEAPPAPAPGLSRPSLQGPALLSLSSIESNSTDGEPGRCEGPDATRKAALVLNAQLALLDKQVLNHVVPRGGTQSQGLSKLSDGLNIQKQVLLAC